MNRLLEYMYMYSYGMLDALILFTLLLVECTCTWMTMVHRLTFCVWLLHWKIIPHLLFYMYSESWQKCGLVTLCMVLRWTFTLKNENKKEGRQKKSSYCFTACTNLNYDLFWDRAKDILNTCIVLDQQEKLTPSIQYADIIHGKEKI